MHICHKIHIYIYILIYIYSIKLEYGLLRLQPKGFSQAPSPTGYNQ